MKRYIQVLVLAFLCSLPLWAQEQFDAHLAGYIPQDRLEKTPSFWDLGFRLAYDIHLYKHYCLEVSCGVKNVLDQFQSDVDKGELRDANYIYGPTQPRTYFAGLSLKL